MKKFATRRLKNFDSEATPNTSPTRDAYVLLPVIPAKLN